MIEIFKPKKELPAGDGLGPGKAAERVENHQDRRQKALSVQGGKIMRSEEGRGEQVSLFNFKDEAFDSMLTPFLNWAILESVGEDYAVSIYPITIKVKQGITVSRLREALMEFLMSLNELEPSKLVHDPALDPTAEGAKFFSIKAARIKKKD